MQILPSLLVAIAAFCLSAIAGGPPPPTDTPSVAPTFSPSKAPTRSPTVTPTRSPTRSGLHTRICPTQIFGTSTGSVVVTGTAVDSASNFTGAASRPISIGRSASTALVWQNTGVNKIIAQFGTNFANNGWIGDANGPNITWNSTLYSFTEAAGVTLQTAIYTPSEIAVLYTTASSNLVLKWLKTRNFAMGSEIDTGLVLTDVNGHLRLLAGYYVVGVAAASPWTVRIQRSMVFSVNGRNTFFFQPVLNSLTNPPRPPMNGVAQSAMDARGLVMIVYPSNSTGTPVLAVTSWSSTVFSNVIEHRAAVPLPGVTANDVPLRISMVSPAANAYLIAYVDRYSGVNQIFTVFTTNAFSTFTNPTLIGSLQVPGGSPSVSLIWNSANIISFWEMATPNAWARNWNWYVNMTNVANFTASNGAWAEHATIMWTAPSAFSRASVSGQTSYGYNLVADTTGLPIGSVAYSRCGVFTRTNTTVRSDARAMSGSIAAMAIGLLAAAVVAY